ncbi:hypothetical protein XM38_004970 [Halomicronema hongdechloris C2206]|uniref:Uncharacterized protein n=1 Tax=Halomicronema hongdechloris C2206 TaxID=1641165 RepID=A0A1Z3HH23_9CYAN|nr:hypothetical protein XM38_004970 [Halomicronema hongdechloris C2206]
MKDEKAAQRAGNFYSKNNQFILLPSLRQAQDKLISAFTQPGPELRHNSGLNSYGPLRRCTHESRKDRDFLRRP